VYLRRASLTSMYLACGEVSSHMYIWSGGKRG
jgi:hypothetical protein